MKEAVISAVIPAAGVGRRMGTDQKKQYILLQGKSILAHTLEVFQHCERISEIIIVTNEDEIDYCKNEIVDRFSLNKVVKIVRGGETRQESVTKGLVEVSEKSSHVLIHDGVRPFVSREALERLFGELEVTEGCILGVPVKDTIKIVSSDGCVESTPNRDQLWAIQTPQVFEKDLLIGAYEKANRESFQGTDDASLVENMTEANVRVIMGEYTNIKITTPEDLLLGERILAK